MFTETMSPQAGLPSMALPSGFSSSPTLWGCGSAPAPSRCRGTWSIVLLLHGALSRRPVCSLGGQRADGAQLAHHFGDGVDHPVGVFLGVVTPEAEAHRAVRSLVVAADAEDHVARLERRAEAGGAGADRESPHVQLQGYRLALDVVERDVGVLRQAAGTVPVEGGVAGSRPSSVEEPVADDPGGVSFSSSVTSSSGRGEADRAGDVLHPGASVELLEATVHPLA